ncbi:glycosyltransferase [Pseudomonas oryzihabitans]|uniref:glycosyltransferase n=1 Tax=Pseudomonas oryzihabitans TaxID=47885 RepID=UPI003CFE4C6C
MKILYVSPESPIFPSGGIGTYILNAAKVMQALGHEIYLYTWTYDRSYQVSDFYPFKRDNVFIELIDGKDVWKDYPAGPYNHAFSMFVKDRILKIVDDTGCDVIESVDYLSPALMLFQEIRNSSRSKRVITSTFNHGLIEESYNASQISKSLAVACDIAGERQQCRASDIVIAPSRNAANKLYEFNIRDNVVLIPEPYDLNINSVPCARFSNRFSHIGRVSIAKGMDKFVLLANIIDHSSPIDRLLFIGKCADTPFRNSDIKSYITGRLRKRLRDVCLFLGEMPRSTALTYLNSGDIAPHLSASETFSYAFLETLNAGLLPLVERGSAMAEFYPEDLSEYLLDPYFRDYKSVIGQYESNIENGSAIISGLAEYNRSRLSPEQYAKAITESYQSTIDKKIGRFSISTAGQLGENATIKDVTVLMPVFKPDHEFYEAIDSIALQVSGQPKVIICDDGNEEEYLDVLQYAKENLNQCEIISQPNLGLLGARNTLINSCTTDLAIFLDADDIIDPGFIEALLLAYNNSDSNAVLPMRHNFSESDEKVIRILIGDHAHLLTNDYRMTALIETQVLKEIGFDSTRRNGEADDWIFWLEFTRRGFNAESLTDLPFYYRFKTGSMSWPWSDGQRVGTQSMIRDVIRDGEELSPFGAKLSTIFMSNNTVNR